jgi:peptidoglycan/xylan/chitin deacetylase (PgdA/CDA1 family)
MADPFPVVLGICLDAEAIWLSKHPDNSKKPVLLSTGTYAIREGLAPMLDLLDAHGVRASFFVPGITADRHPEAVKVIHRRGHELGSHTYSHRPVAGLSAEEENDEIVRGIEAVERHSGLRPTTWRSASWEWSAETLRLIRAAGVTASCNFQDRLRPYRHMVDGQPTEVVELPVHWHLADAPFFLYGGDVQRRVRPVAEAEAVWMDEFDATYDWPGTYFHLTLHVQLMGHPGRLRMLDRILHRMRDRPRTKVMTCAEVAATVG